MSLTNPFDAPPTPAPSAPAATPAGGLPDPNALLMTGGYPAAKFPEVGATVVGIVVAMETRQRRDFTTGEPMTYSDGTPIPEVLVDLRTDERDPSDPADDGTRRLYVRGAMLTAIRSAIRAAHADGLTVGGQLAVRYSADGEPSQRGWNPPKQYQAHYTPPAAEPPTVRAEDLADVAAQVAAAPPF